MNLFKKTFKQGDYSVVLTVTRGIRAYTVNVMAFNEKTGNQISDSIESGSYQGLVDEIEARLTSTPGEFYTFLHELSAA